MTTHFKTVSVDVTVVSSNEAIVDQCLASLFQTVNDGNVKLRVMLSWNARGTGGPQLPSTLRARYPQVEMIDNPVSGYEINQNLLLDQCSGDYQLVINDDLIFLPGSIDGPVQFMEESEHSTVGVLSIRYLNPDGSLQPSTYSFPGMFRTVLAISGLRRVVPLTVRLHRMAALFGLGRGRSRYWAHDRTVEVDTVRGAYLLVRHAALRRAGLMCEGGLETEWIKRFSTKGWQIVFYHNAEVIHLGSQTVSRDPYRTIMDLRAFMVFYERHRHAMSFLCLRGFCLVLFSLQYVSALWATEPERQKDLALRALTLVRDWAKPTEARFT